MFYTRGEFEDPKKNPNIGKGPNQDSSNDASFARSADMVLPNILTVTNISRDAFIGIFSNIGHDAGRYVAGEIYDSIFSNEVLNIRALRETSRYYSDPLSIVWSSEFHFEDKKVEQSECSIEICCSEDPIESPLPYIELKRTGTDITLSIHLYRLENLSWESASELIDTILPHLSLGSLKDCYSTSREILFELDGDLCVKVGENLALDCSIVADPESDEELDLDEISLPRSPEDSICLYPLAIQLFHPNDEEMKIMLSQVFGREVAQVVSESGLISSMNKFIQPIPSVNSRALKRIATQIGISGDLFYCQGGVLTGSEQEEDGVLTLPINREVFFKHKEGDSIPVSFVLRPSLYSRSAFVAGNAEAIPTHQSTFGLEFLRNEGDSDSEFRVRSWKALMGLSDSFDCCIEEETITQKITELRDSSEEQPPTDVVEYYQGRFNFSFKMK